MTLRHALLAVLVTTIWGVNFLMIDIGLDDTSPLVLVALRFALVAVPAILFVRKPDVPWRSLVGIGLASSAGQFGLLFTAISLGLPAGLAAIVLQVQMVFTLLIGVAVLHERLRPKQIIGAGIAVVGLAIVGVGRIDGVSDFGVLVPLLICIAAGLSWAIGNVITRVTPGTGGLPTVVWSGAVVPVPMMALALVVEGPDVVGESLTTMGWQTLLAVAYTAILASLVGYGIWNSLLNRYPASVVAPYSLLVPPIGLLATIVVLHEVPSTIELVGGALMVAGIAVSSIRYGRWRAASDVSG